MERLLFFTKTSGAYGGGILTQYFATIQKTDNRGRQSSTTKSCKDLAARLFAKHADLTKEKSWAIFCSALSDALNPSANTGCTAEDQESAFAWFESDPGCQIMDSLKLNQDFVLWAIRKLKDGSLDIAQSDRVAA